MATGANEPNRKGVRVAGTCFAGISGIRVPSASVSPRAERRAAPSCWLTLAFGTEPRLCGLLLCDEPAIASMRESDRGKEVGRLLWRRRFSACCGRLVVVAPGHRRVPLDPIASSGPASSRAEACSVSARSRSRPSGGGVLVATTKQDCRNSRGRVGTRALIAIRKTAA
jgi:hypothetical protein